jgi:hypothetical protein
LRHSPSHRTITTAFWSISATCLKTAQVLKSWTTRDLAEVKARRLYERVYCALGEMKNRIKECQLDLFADRTSAGTMRANQARLWLASFAYVLMHGPRRIGPPEHGSPRPRAAPFERRC